MLKRQRQALGIGFLRAKGAATLAPYVVCSFLAAGLSLDLRLSTVVLVWLAIVASVFAWPDLGLVLAVTFSSTVKGAVLEHLQGPDPTVGLFLLTATALAIRRRTGATLPPPVFVVCTVAFLGLLTVSIAYSPLPSWGVQVVLRFALLTLSVLVGVVVWLQTEEDVKRLLRMFAVAALGTGIANLLVIVVRLRSANPFEGFRALASGSAIGMGTILATGLVAAWVCSRSIEHRLGRVLWRCAMLIGALELIGLNTRGPVLGLLLAVVIVGVTVREARRQGLVALGLLGVVAAGIASALPHFVSRYALTTVLGGESARARVDAWRLVGQHFGDWFWTGAGAFGYAQEHAHAFGVPLELYGSTPHNLYLDVFCHVGFPGVLLFSLLLWLPVRDSLAVARHGSAWSRPLGAAVLGGLIICLTNGLFSLSLIDTRVLWFFGGLALAVRRIVASPGASAAGTRRTTRYAAEETTSWGAPLPLRRTGGVP